MTEVHIVKRFLEGIMAGRTTGKNTTTTKKVEASKLNNTSKEKVVEVAETNEVVKKEESKVAEASKITEKDEKAAPQKKTKKAVVNKTAEKKESSENTETTVKKTVETGDDSKKKTRKTGSRNNSKEQLIPEVYLQYCGQESDQSAVVEKIKEQYVAEGHRLGNIKSLKIYLKPEDRAAYYVINDRFAGKVDLF